MRVLVYLNICKLAAYLLVGQNQTRMLTRTHAQVSCKNIHLSLEKEVV